MAPNFYRSSYRRSVSDTHYGAVRPGDRQPLAPAERMAAALLKLTRFTAQRTAITGGSAGRRKGGTEATSVDPPPTTAPFQFEVVVPNNGSVALPVLNPANIFGGYNLDITWKRGASRGNDYLHGKHDGTTATLERLNGTNPGWGVLSAAVAGDNLTLTLRANNNVHPIQCWIEIRHRPLIPSS